MRSIEEASLLRRSLPQDIHNPARYAVPVGTDAAVIERTHLLTIHRSPPLRSYELQPSKLSLSILDEFRLLQARQRTKTTTTYTTVKATSLIYERPKPSSTNSEPTKATKTKSATKPTRTPQSIEQFIALYVGAMGACVDRKDTFRICSGASLAPKFAKTYNDSKLPDDVIDLLPEGTAGGTFLLMVALLLYSTAIVAFALAFRATINARTKSGYRAYPKANYIYPLATATIANVAGAVVVITSLLVLKKVFQEALEEIPKLPYELFPGGGGAITPLAITCAAGVLSALVSVYILTGDIRLIITENAEARRRQAEKAKSRDGQNQPHAEQDAMRTGRERETPTDVAKALAEPHGLPRTVRKGDGIQAKDSSRKKSNSLSSLWRRVMEPSKPKPERFLDVAASAEDKGEFYPRGRPVGDEGNNPGHTSFADEARRQDRRSGPAIRTRYSDNDNGEWSPGPREPIKPFKIRRRGSTWSSLQEKLGMRH